MFWVFLSLSAYFLIAVVEITDKQILSSPKLGALVYAFYAGLLTSVALLFWPLSFAFLPLDITFYALIAGISFFAAIFFLYSAIIQGEVSRVVSIIGGLSPIIIFFFSYFFLGERLRLHSFIALLMLIAGSLILSFVRDGEKYVFGKHFFLDAFLASVFLALTYFLTKVVFLNAKFFNGFIWIRVGTLLCTLAVFLMPATRKYILEGAKGFSGRLTALFIFNKGISALAHLALNFAIKLGTVAIVNALQAVEYVFIFVLTMGLSYFAPQVFNEPLTFKTLAPKLAGIALISTGVILLFVGF